MYRLTPFEATDEGIVKVVDPRREIEKLRDHLAAHDKPITFLFGAGTSCAVEGTDHAPLIPALGPVGQLCEQAVTDLGGEFAAGFDDLKGGAAWDIEQVLSDVRRKVDAMGPNDELIGLSRGQLVTVAETIQGTIATAASPPDARIPSVLPHAGLARWVTRIDRKHPVEIFTTNYDTLLERALEEQREPVFDGFVGSRSPFFSAASLDQTGLAPGSRWTRLWKVHGSINWSRETVADGSDRIVRGAENTSGQLILPSLHKYDESRRQPYIAILDHLQDVLADREDGVVVTCGYSFRDQHINEVLFDGLRQRERLHLFALCFSDPDENSDLVKRALQRPNLLVYGPRTVIAGGVQGEWRLAEPVSSATAPLIDIGFDSDASIDPDEPMLTGRFRLGDFAWLCRFLDTLAPDDES